MTFMDAQHKMCVSALKTPSAEEIAGGGIPKPCAGLRAMQEALPQTLRMAKWDL